MKKLFLFCIFTFTTATVLSHDDNEERIKFWKEYYNPKIEAEGSSIPSVNISLIKNKPFYQVKTNIRNFKFTPEKNMQNNF